MRAPDEAALSRTRILLLPGLDGTGRLFRPFLDCLPGDVDAEVVEYPHDEALGLDDLVSLAASRIERGARHVVLAESFSGPVGVLYALRRREDVEALVFSASFLGNPLPRPLGWLPRLAHRRIIRGRPPRLIARAFLVGFDAPPAVVEAARDATRMVAREVIAARLRSIASTDVSVEARRLDLPVLYLLGERDRLVGGRGAAQVRRALPRTVIRRLGAPHLVLQTRPRESVAAIADFLRDTQAKGDPWTSS